jgi:hypothetical protein
VQLTDIPRVPQPHRCLHFQIHSPPTIGSS